MKYLSFAVLAFSLSSPLMAAPKWDEVAIIKAVGVKVMKKKIEQDGTCKMTSYTFKSLPDMVLEFRCNRVNVAWDRFPEKGYEKKNQEAAQLAKLAASALSQGSGKEVDDAMSGQVMKERSLLSGLTVGGSCSSASCLLTYHPRAGKVQKQSSGHKP
ncbi:hypothetical protein [Chromobacterium sphagni]|uniref:Uncharacterized protein n=1 Tax=Chromobacterium sphagni TaxID=1903179 RepID=A0ABX3CDN4_9NEIS|nr:hypothetical protein [Chromobacterium sphagni]OHX20420.1 hypothetical protein BI344_08075 [Chromobacterium sphagni]